MGEKKVIISPKGSLLDVPVEWRRLFLIKSAEKALAEGRYTEIMQDITGITIDMLTQSKVTHISAKLKPPATLVPEQMSEVKPALEFEEVGSEVMNNKPKVRHNF